MRKRIPTLLALIVLVALIVFGIFLQIMNKRQNDALKAALVPKHELIANITTDQAAIIWHTDTPTVGSIKLNNQIINDDRDTSQTKTARITHFVTLQNLTANTKYQYKIRNNEFEFEDQNFQFSTNNDAIAQKQLNQPPQPAIRGSVMNQKNEPQDEAIVILNSKDLAPKATFLTLSGNFILPLTKLTNTQATDVANIPDKSPATLEVRKAENVSFIQISIPIRDRSLPSITLGKNDNVTALLAQPIASTSPLEFVAKQPVFDLNSDGKINTLNSSLINDLIAKKQFNPQADFNNDKIIDNNDLELIKDEIK